MAPERLDIVCRALISSLLLFFAIVHWRVQEDDAYIFYTYARNIAAGNGYVFNLGERINGTTSPLYTLLIAVLSLAFGWVQAVTIPFIGYALGIIGLSITVILSQNILRDENAKLRLVPILFPFLFIIHPSLRLAIGMETFLTLGLLSLTLYKYLRHDLTWASFFAALSILSRPDSVLFAGVLFVDFILRERKFPPLRAALVFLLTLLPWYIFSFLYFGALLPATLQAKLAQVGSERWGSGYLFLRKVPYNIHLLRSFAWTFAILLGLVALGWRHWIKNRAILLLFAWTLLYILAYGVILNAPGYKWYYTPLAIGGCLVTALAIETGMRFFSFGDRTFRKIMVGLIALVTILAGLSFSSKIGKPYSTKFYKYKETAKWLNANAEKSSSVGATEIGILGYFYQRGRIIDGLGLITPEVAEHVRTSDYAWYVRTLKPEFLVFNKPPRRALETFVEENWFNESYQLVRVIHTLRESTAVYKRK